MVCHSIIIFDFLFVFSGCLPVVVVSIRFDFNLSFLNLEIYSPFPFHFRDIVEHQKVPVSDGSPASVSHNMVERRKWPGTINHGNFWRKLKLISVDVVSKYLRGIFCFVRSSRGEHTTHAPTWKRKVVCPLLCLPAAPTVALVLDGVKARVYLR